MGLYIQMHSMHGLFRSKNLELGRDEDTGGQIVYVLELAKALGKKKDIDKVDIITRRIIDDQYPGYSEKIEEVTEKVNIVRINCGPKKYIKKVNLWPYLPEFIENVKKYIKKIDRKPDIFQSNYADSGKVCSILSKELQIPQVHTGHSLGKPKMKRLGVNDENFDRFNNIFHFETRLEAEQFTLNTADAVIASTREELKKQYSPYEIDEELFKIIPPGINIDMFYPPSDKNPSEQHINMRQMLENLLTQNMKEPEKPLVTTLSRLDERKNLHGLLESYGKDKELQELANLLIFAQTLEGNEDDQEIIEKINRIIHKYNLYENIVIPAIHLDYDTQVPEYYRFISEKKGVFVNPALIEPFGLTIIEAGACGIPVVATKNGGPSEIIDPGKNGYLIDPKDPKDISAKIKKLLKDKKLWEKISKNSIQIVKDQYSWRACARKYLMVFKEVIK
ncbi:glycosyltransferase [Candidatus Woesearchaeota archaeon]|nr:glycosyltransferase [Candidatus Woesearchaeota archaeon]